MQTMEWTLLLVGYAVAINLAGWGAFAWDKRRAREGLWRVPERTLLAIAAIGGSPGAILAMRTLRHKTRKQPFGAWMRVIVAVQACVLLAACFPEGRAFVRQFLREFAAALV